MLSLLLTFFSSAISPAYADVPYEIHRQPITIDAGNKKLNLARCDDADDWYLDGYATARSFPNHKEKLYNARVQYCKKFMTVEQQYIDQWNEGFNVYGKVEQLPSSDMPVEE